MIKAIILDSLNDAQLEAVTAPFCHQLVLAGAGSGKTRVLVHRIAWLIHKEGLSPFNVLAVTFTNKAAKEMRFRIENLLEMSAKSMWIGTFHSLAHRILRMHWREAGLPEGFQILDSDDQYRLIRRVIASLELDEDRWPPKQVQWFINSKKDEALEPQHLPDYGDITTRTMIKIYRAYEEACARAGLIDFADLLLKSHKLFLTHPDILAHYQTRFRYILVDEFQDTNAIQYAWVRLLAGKDTKVMIVGDDDQSIYGWRGAKIENIHRFCKDFPNAITTRLEQNYRSTGTILKAANALIQQNEGRMGKNLWTSGSEGERIIVYAGYNDLDEARFLVNRIRDWQREGENLRGLLGVLFTIPLRRALLIDKTLRYPEGFAITNVLKASVSKEKSDIKSLVWGGAIGGLISLFQTGFQILTDSFQYWVKGNQVVYGFGLGLSPALIAAGYIVGINVSISLFVGIIIGWLGGIPTLTWVFGIPNLDNANDIAMSIWRDHVKIMGVGTMLIGGLWTIFTLLKPIAHE